MKGVILAGGRGSRLDPLTEVTNKHLLPVGREPMIWHGVRQLTQAGVADILVVTSTEHMGDIVNSLGSGKKFNCQFTFRVQEESNGIAAALAMVESFSAGDKIVVLLGDNIFEHSIAPHVADFAKQKKGARVLLKEVAEPERFGIAALDEKQIISIEEKPANPKSSYAVVGCYMYDHQVFDFIRQIKPSGRGEYEITSVNNIYIRKKELEFGIVKGRWTDAGTFDSFIEANLLLVVNSNRILS